MKEMLLKDSNSKIDGYVYKIAELLSMPFTNDNFEEIERLEYLIFVYYKLLKDIETIEVFEIDE